jgi:hypothetical protein
MIKKTPHMVVEKYEPPKKKTPVKSLCAEIAVRHKRAVQRLLDEGDIDEAEFDALGLSETSVF